jgi:molecular chaperone DnaK
MSGRLAIDFGTSNTVLAVWSEEQQIGITHHIPDYGQLYTQGESKVSLIPSLIHYDSNQRRWLGNQVLQRNLEKSDRTFRWIKRYIANRSPVKRRIDQRQIPYTEAGQDFLSTVLLFATTELNITDEEIAFTVPVESFEHYEAWLGEVAQQAGIRRFRLIDEPSAAALGYGAHIQPGDVYLIFDFGGGTLDVAVVLIEDEESQSGRRCRVLGKSGVDLGGTNLDQLLFLEVLNQSGYTDSDETIRRLSGALLVECEQAKIRLSSRDRAEISVLDPNTGTVIGADISRSRFEELMDENEVFSQLDQTIRRSLNQARERGYQEENIKSVLLVGGSSQIPSIQRTIRQIFGKDRVLLDRPLDAVARGAAAFISGIDFYDHIQHDYAIRFFNRQTQKYDYKTLVPRGTPYPTTGAIANLTIKATHEGQERLGMALFEVSEARRRSNSVELVFDPSGAARMVDVSPDEEERRTYFWLNEDSPTFLQTKTPSKSGDPCFRVEFSIDDNKRLLMTTRDLKTLQITHKDYPVVKLT